MSLSGDKGVAQFKKSVKMGHPSGKAHACVVCLVNHYMMSLSHESNVSVI